MPTNVRRFTSLSLAANVLFKRTATVDYNNLLIKQPPVIFKCYPANRLQLFERRWRTEWNFSFSLTKLGREKRYELSGLKHALAIYSFIKESCDISRYDSWCILKSNRKGNNGAGMDWGEDLGNKFWVSIQKVYLVWECFETIIWLTKSFAFYNSDWNFFFKKGFFYDQHFYSINSSGIYDLILNVT